jgi:hypothetical protein
MDVGDLLLEPRAKNVVERNQSHRDRPSVLTRDPPADRRNPRPPRSRRAGSSSQALLAFIGRPTGALELGGADDVRLDMRVAP